MKKLIILLLGILLLPTIVFASGDVTVSKSSITLEVGSSTTFEVKANNSAGKVTVTSSNSSIVTIDKSSEWLDNSSLKVKVTAKKVGNAEIKVSVNAASYDEKEIIKSYTIKVNVNPVRSNNNYSLVISGLNLKFNKNTYKYILEAENSLKSVQISANAEDSKSSVNGTGNKTLKDGKNTFSIVVTAENGSKRTYQVIINRKNALGVVKELSSDNKIKKLSIDNYSISFNSNNNDYYLYVSEDVDSLKFNITLSDNNAKYEILNNENFNKSINEVKIVVTSEDESENIYNILVLKKDLDKESEKVVAHYNESNVIKALSILGFICVELLLIIVLLITIKRKKIKKEE